jgi:RNA recognition motif-containing protein
VNDVRVYVGNLPFKTTNEELKKLFDPFGKVKSADVIRYRESGRSKGYAFVIIDEPGANKSIEQLNDNEYESRILKVRIAKPRENFPREDKPKSQGVKSIRLGID